jgi:hypothetical protein
LLIVDFLSGGGRVDPRDFNSMFAREITACNQVITPRLRKQITQMSLRIAASVKLCALPGEISSLF